MRAMLILVLLYSLAQLAKSDKPADGCTDIYACYAPDVCITGGTDLNASPVVKVDANTVRDTCPALIKFHEYRANWVHVSIESFVDGTTSIDFLLITRADDGVKRKFSCAVSGNKIEGKYLGSTKYSADYVAGAKLKCKFEVKPKLSGQTVFYRTTNTEAYLFSIGTANALPPVKTLKTPGQQISIVKMGCDPSKFIFNNEVDREKVYAKIQYKPGQYYCDYPEIFKIQYRPIGETPRYVNKIGCDQFSVFEIGTDKVDTETIDVRCVAEVEYFCHDYDVKKKDNSEFPKQSKSKWNEAAPRHSSLTCPPDQPHLIVNSKLILNPEFKCQNYGNSKYWTVKDNGETIFLTSKGPELKCTATVECDQRFKISETAVPTGRLGIDRFPECFPTGVLKVNGAAITGHRCDKSTGEFKFKTGGQEQIVTPDTKFVCEYPDNKDQAEMENAKHNRQLGIGVFGSIFGSLALVIIAVGIFVAALKRRQRRDMKKAVERNEVVFSKYGMDKDEQLKYKMDLKAKKEKEAEKKKKKDKRSDDESEGESGKGKGKKKKNDEDEKVEEEDAQGLPKMDETWTWNQHITHYRKESWAAAAFRLANGLWTGNSQFVNNTVNYKVADVTREPWKRMEIVRIGGKDSTQLNDKVLAATEHLEVYSYEKGIEWQTKADQKDAKRMNKKVQ